MDDTPGLSRRAFFAGSLALLAACKINRLPKYHALLHSAVFEIDVRRGPTVNTAGGSERESSGLSGMVNAATNLAKGIISLKLQKRMQQIIPAMRASTIVTEAMIARFPDIGLQHATPPAAADTRLALEIRAYGLETLGDMDPAKYFVNARATLYHEPSGKKIWRLRRQLSRPIADVHVAFGSDSVVGNISNTAALDKLTDEDLERVLVAMLADATALFVATLADDLDAARAGGR